MKETITIDKAVYDQLVHDQKILSALYAGGVNNWEWYSESLQDGGLFDDEEDYEEDEED